MTATLLALGSLLCAALKDLSFRIFASKQNAHSHGTYIAIIGLTWLLACITVCFVTAAQWNSASLLWGTGIGLSGGLSNILLARAMSNCDTAICSTMYRLNLVPAALLMIFLFNEPSDIMTWCGITCAALAVWFFTDAAPGKISDGFLILCMASALRALMGITMKAGSVFGASTWPTLSIAAAVWLCCGLAWDRQLKCDKRTLHFGFVSGLLTIGVAACLYIALSLGNGAIIIPLSQLSFVVTAVLAWLLLNERLNMRQSFAIVCAMFSIVILGVG